MKTFAADFETLYNDELSVKPLGAHAYFDALSLEDIYLVSVVGDDGFKWVGHPKDLDWSFVKGNQVLFHNAQFDTQGLRRLRDLGVVIPEPAEINDTADLAAYVGLPRALAGAAHTAFGFVHDKSIRDKSMKGLGWNDMEPELREAVKEYALKDSELCLRLWQKYSPLWPENERLVSRLTREWVAEGIPADMNRIDAAISHIKNVVFQARTNIPWVLDDKPPLSPKALAIQCREVGIPCPKSLAMDDEDCAKWEDRYGEQFPWVGHMRDFRRANAILKKLEAMKVRISGGRLRYGLKYWGAGQTGRWCLTGNAEVLTKNGWVKLLHYDARQPILQWHPDTKTLSWCPSPKLHTFPPCHGMVKLKSRHLDLNITPEHRMPFLTKGGAVEFDIAKNLLNRARTAFPMSGVMDVKEASTPLSEDDIRLLVAAQADGHNYASDKGRGWRFSFRKQRKILRMSALLERLGIPHIKKAYTDRVCFTINHDCAPWYLCKEFNTGFILTLPTSHLLAFVDELKHWDGCTDPRTGAVTFSTTSENNANVVALLCHITGKRATITKKDRQKEGWNTSFEVSIWAGENTPCYIEKDQWIKNAGSSRELFCPETSTGAFLCRYNGKIFVSGNSGDAGINLQNVSGKELYGVNMRSMLVAEPGHSFIACDYASVEPKVGAWLCEDTFALEQFRQGVSPYIVHARATMGLGPDETWEKSSKLYKLSKIRCLLLSYGGGHHRFLEAASAMGQSDLFNDPVSTMQVESYTDYLEKMSSMPKWKGVWEAATPEGKTRLVNSWLIVQDFRSKSTHLTTMWGQLQAALNTAAAKGEDLTLELPSGNRLLYKNCRLRRKTQQDGGGTDVVADITRNGMAQTTRLFATILYENLCQSISRDIHRDGLIRLHEAGYQVVLHVHDEAVVHVPKDRAEAAKQDMERIMGIHPTWAPTLPVAAEATLADSYDQAK